MSVRTVKADTDYIKLVRACPLRAITSQKEANQVTKFIEPLAVKDELTDGEEMYLLAQTALIETWENLPANRLPSANPVDVLKFLLDENEMTASDLGRLLGSRTLGTLILNGKRQLSKAHIRILSERFKVSPALFI